MRTEEGNTPAHEAAFRGNMDILNLLIENGADLELQNGQEQTCFDLIIVNDNLDLFECVYSYAKKSKKSFK